MLRTTLCYLERERKNERQESVRQYLMLHRVKKKGDTNQDKWIGVGGKFEEGESPEQCVCREVYEETGIRLQEYRFRGIVTFHSDLYPSEEMYLFTAALPKEMEGEELPECAEGDLVWVDTDRLDRLNLWEGDKVFFALLEENLPFFTCTLTYRGDVLVDVKVDRCSM